MESSILFLEADSPTLINSPPAWGVKCDGYEKFDALDITALMVLLTSLLAGRLSIVAIVDSKSELYLLGTMHSFVVMKQCIFKGAH